jgi:histidinol-phosphate aminotransferase
VDFLTEKARQLTPYVAGLQPRDTGWIKLNTNENPYPPSPKVIEMISGADLSALKLYPDGDSGGLSEAIAKICGVRKENVFCGNGSDEVIALAYQAFFSGKANVLTPDISYGFYPVWNDMYDVNATILPLDENYAINAEDYRDANGVIIANPNAPTGMALTLPEIELIVRNNPNGVVLVDEAYMDFAQTENAVSLTEKYENLLVTRTFSKSYSLAGLRVGFAVGSEALIGGLQRMKDAFNSYPLGMLEQIGAKAAILDIEYWNACRNRIITTRDNTISVLRGMNYTVLDSHANFFFMKAKDAKKLYEFLAANKVLVRYWDKPRINEFLRVTVGTDEEMEVFLQCVKRF